MKKYSVLSVLAIAVIIEFSGMAQADSTGCKVDINGISVSGTTEVGSPVTFTTNSSNSCSDTIYYRYSMHPDYDTDGYDGLNWSSMTSSEYTTDSSIDYTFDEEGKYIVVVWAVDDQNNVEPNGVPLIGGSVEISDTVDCTTAITDMTVSGTLEVNTDISFTVNATNNCSDTLSYRYSVHLDYGTDGYDGLHWTSMTSTEYVSSNTIDYQFDKAGKYIVVVWVVDDQNNVDANGVPIIGGSVEIDEIVAGTVTPTPTNVSATDGTYTDKVRITWDSISGVDSYKVFRSTTINGSATLLQSTSNSYYDDTTATAGTTYYYWVKAVNDSRASNFSTYNTGYKAI